MPPTQTTAPRIWKREGKDDFEHGIGTLSGNGADCTHMRLSRADGTECLALTVAPMRIAILGAGPAGLYLAYLIKRRRPDADITVIEQNPADATFGFGVVFSDRALEFLREDDAETYAAIAPQMESWNDITLVHRNERIVIDGIGFAAIGRLKLLQLLQARAALGRRRAGILARGDLARRIRRRRSGGRRRRRQFAGAAQLRGAIRRPRHSSRQPLRLVRHGQPFDTLTQTFRHTPIGDFNAHHYRYAPGRSTFIVEMDEATFARAGFERWTRRESRRVCEKVFADALDGHPLISNNSIWRRFPHRAQCALAARQIRADRRRAAHRAFLHRLRHAAGDGGRHRARQGAWPRTATMWRPRSGLRSGAAADRGKARGRRQWQRGMVREFRRTHEARAG